jgi:hypothetical protein
MADRGRRQAKVCSRRACGKTATRYPQACVVTTSSIDPSDHQNFTRVAHDPPSGQLRGVVA